MSPSNSQSDATSSFTDNSQNDATSSFTDNSQSDATSSFTDNSQSDATSSFTDNSLSNVTSSFTDNSQSDATSFAIKEDNSPFRFYRTVTNFSNKNIPPAITTLKEIPYVLLPSTDSYAIYTLEELKLQFLGPVVPNTISTIYSGVYVYMFTRNTVYKTYRGEIIDSIELTDIFIKGVASFGSKFIIYSEDTVVICECGLDDRINDLVVTEEDEKYTSNENTVFLNEIYRVSYDKRILSVFHPHSYVNKILISFEDGTFELYNINSRKTIFEFSSTKPVSFISQTSVVDVVGLVQNDGTIEMFNLKKNMTVFTLPEFVGSTIRGLSFKGRMASVVTGDDEMILYDLEIKREVFRRSKVYSCVMINEAMALVVTSSSIEIFTLDDFSVLKSRKILNENILGISSYSTNEIILHSPGCIFKMNVYRDEMSCFLKNKYPVEKIDFECNMSGISENTVLNSNIVMYGEGKVFYIDKDSKFRNFIDMKCRILKVFRDFCILGSKKKLVVMNLKSKRVISAMNIDEDVLDACLENESFTVLFRNRIEVFNFKLKSKFKADLESNIINGNIKKYGEIYFIQAVISSDVNSDNTDVLLVVSGKAIGISRRFDVEKYSVDSSANIIVGIKNTQIRLYDIASGNLLDTINTNKTLKDVCIIDGLKFICVLDSESQIHLLSNVTHFNTSKASDVFGSVEAFLEIPVIKKQSNFYKDLTLYKNFDAKIDSDLVLKGLSRSEVKDLLGMIKMNLKKDFHGSQKMLGKLLLYKASQIDAGDLKEIKEEIEIRYKEIEENVLSLIGFLNIRQNTTI